MTQTPVKRVAARLTAVMKIGVTTRNVGRRTLVDLTGSNVELPSAGKIITGVKKNDAHGTGAKETRSLMMRGPYAIDRREVRCSVLSLTCSSVPAIQSANRPPQ